MVDGADLERRQLVATNIAVNVAQDEISALGEAPDLATGLGVDRVLHQVEGIAPVEQERNREIEQGQEDTEQRLGGGGAEDALLAGAALLGRQAGGRGDRLLQERQEAPELDLRQRRGEPVAKPVTTLAKGSLPRRKATKLREAAASRRTVKATNTSTPKRLRPEKKALNAAS